MNNPERILGELDSHLDHSVNLILFGRAALSLGYPEAPGEFAATFDVDAILPEVEMARYEADEQFWEALEKTNHALEESGFYITHLFSDQQVILSPDWLEDIVKLSGPWSHLKIFRPSTTDLILTKMMRNDPQDWDDIQFLLRQLTTEERNHLPAKIQAAVVPPVVEIEEAFATVKSRLGRIVG